MYLTSLTPVSKTTLDYTKSRDLNNRVVFTGASPDGKYLTAMLKSVKYMTMQVDDVHVSFDMFHSNISLNVRINLARKFADDLQPVSMLVVADLNTREGQLMAFEALLALVFFFRPVWLFLSLTSSH
jgi:hypothetical protein